MPVLQTVEAVRVFVHDLARARRFYGATLELDETDTGPGYATFALGGVNIVVEAVPPDDAEAAALVGRLLGVSFRVAGDIEAVYRHLVARGVTMPEPPERQPWGGRLVFPRDPDGNILTLVG